MKGESTVNSSRCKMERTSPWPRTVTILTFPKCIAEQFNHTILDMLHAMLFAHNLPQYLWSESINHATYINNRSYTKAHHQVTPEGKWRNYKPDVSHLQEFGTPVWIINEQINLYKLEPKTSKVLFMSYMDRPKAIRYFDE